MNCKIDGCENKIMYKKDMVCQKHYFRFMRYKTYDLTSVRKYRSQNSAGYQKLYEPNHPLSNSDGYVYEHRKVYYDSKKNISNCKLCGKEINWKNLHIDHIDKDVTNNNIENLRPLCRPCNTFRDADLNNYGKTILTCDGKSMTPTAWAREDNVLVSANTIRLRYLKGWSDCDCIFKKRTTHSSTYTKKKKLIIKIK